MWEYLNYGSSTVFESELESELVDPSELFSFSELIVTLSLPSSSSANSPIKSASNSNGFSCSLDVPFWVPFGLLLFTGSLPAVLHGPLVSHLTHSNKVRIKRLTVCARKLQRMPEEPRLRYKQHIPVGRMLAPPGQLK